MNQDECTPVPITLQPRSPYFYSSTLDFCHFKANETVGETRVAESKRGGDGLPPPPRIRAAIDA